MNTQNHMDLACDRDGLLREARDRLATLERQAADWGCEVGSERYCDIAAYRALLATLSEMPDGDVLLRQIDAVAA